MSTATRKARKRAGVPFVKAQKPAKALSPAEYAEVERFGLHEEEVLGTTEGVRWGFRLILLPVGFFVAIVAVLLIGEAVAW